MMDEKVRSFEFGEIRLEFQVKGLVRNIERSYSELLGRLKGEHT